MHASQPSCLGGVLHVRVDTVCTELASSRAWQCDADAFCANRLFLVARWHGHAKGRLGVTKLELSTTSRVGDAVRDKCHGEGRA